MDVAVYVGLNFGLNNGLYIIGIGRKNEREKERKEGMKEGRKEGRKEERKKGRKEERKEGRKQREIWIWIAFCRKQTCSNCV